MHPKTAKKYPQEIPWVLIFIRLSGKIDRPRIVADGILLLFNGCRLSGKLNAPKGIVRLIDYRIELIFFVVYKLGIRKGSKPFIQGHGASQVVVFDNLLSILGKRQLSNLLLIAQIVKLIASHVYGKIIRNDAECIAEPNKVFKSDNGKVTSNYEIGNYFSTAFLNYTENGIVAQRDHTALQNLDIALKAEKISTANLIVSDTQNIIDTSEEFSKIGQKMSDICEKYTVLIISGQISAEEGMAKINEECKNVGYDKAEEFMRQKAEE